MSPGRICRALLHANLLILLAGVPTPSLAAKEAISIAIPSDIESMDPHLAGGLSMRVWANVYENLLSRGPDGKLEPRLATSWRQIDPTHWEFKIRPGVKFSSGNPLTAQAAADSFNKKNDPASPHTHIGFTKWIKSARATGDDTLVIETDGPFAPALFYLATSLAGAIYDTKARAEGGDLKTKSAGTGPYVLDKIEPGRLIQLRANPDYWGGKPKTPLLQFRPVPEEVTRVLALKRGETDIVLDLGPESLAQLKGDATVKTDVYRRYRINTIEYNFLDPLIRDNKDLREAVRLAIDTKAIVQNLLGAAGDPADSIVLDVSWGYASVPEFLRHDPARAKALLDAAGWKPGADGIREKDGKKLQLTFVTDHARDYRNREIAQAVQSFLQEVGIALDVKLLDRGPFVDTVIQKGAGYHLNIQGWGSPTNEASWWIYTRLHSDSQNLGAWGTTRNRMPELDRKIDAARRETDESKALPLWKEIQEIVARDSLMIPVVFLNGIQGVRTAVKGFVTHGDEWYGYRYVDAVVD